MIYFLCYIHFIEKANGIKYLYASVDKHPNVRAVVTLANASITEEEKNILLMGIDNIHTRMLVSL